MGKAKRFNTYDGAVADKRKIVEGFGQQRQNLSIGSSFRTAPQAPPIATTTSPVPQTPGNPGGVSFPIAYPVDDQGSKAGNVTHSLTATTAHKLQFTATAACDITITGFGSANASALDFYIEVTQDGTGGHAITFNDAEVINPPTITTTADTTSLLACHADGDGNIRIVTLLNASPSSGFSGNLSDLTIDTDFDANGVRKFILDADADTYLIGDTDDRIEFFTGNTEKLRLDTELQLQGGVNLDLNGNDLIFGTGTAEYMDHGASSNIRLYTASTLRSTWDATGQSMASGYRLTMDDEIRFTGITKPGTNTQSKIYAENLTNDELVLNAPTSGKVRMDIAGTEISEFAATAAQFQSSLGYDFTFFRDDASPLDNDSISRFDFQGNNDIGGTDIYARIEVLQNDVSSGGEDATIKFSVMDAGTLKSMFEIIDDVVTVTSNAFRFETNADIEMNSLDIHNIGALNKSSPPSITGSRSGNAALASLLSAFDGELWTDNTTA